MTSTTQAVSMTSWNREMLGSADHRSDSFRRSRTSTCGKRPIHTFGVIMLTLAALEGCGTNADESGIAEISSAVIGVPAQIGVFRNGTWFLDTNGDNVWNGVPTDAIGSFGSAGDIPLVHKLCNPAAQTKQLFVTRGSSQWFSTANDFDWNGGDQAFVFGFQSTPMFPVMLGGHIAAVGHSPPGTWLWDINDNKVFDPGDLSFSYGADGDIPVAGNWGSGPTEGPGVFRNGLWIVDSNNNRVMDGGDAQFNFGGGSGDFPVVADFNPNRPGSEVAIFQSGTWFVDFNGNRSWDGVGGGDQLFFFGQAGDIPVVAIPAWRNVMCFQ